MSADRETTRIVRSWLEDGRTALPDRVLDAVLDQLPATRQRRVSWPARRFDDMTPHVRLGGAIAALVVLAIAGSFLILRSGGSVGPPGPPSPTPPPVPLMAGASPGTDLPPGTYLIDRPFPVRATLAVPPGWAQYLLDPQEAAILVNHARPSSGSGWGLALLHGPHFYVDPCTPGAGLVDQANVASAQKMVAFLSSLPAVEATTSSTSVGGRPATRVALTADPDTAACANRGATIWSFADGGTYVISPGGVTQLTIVDVEGTPIAILTSDYPESSHWENQMGDGTPNPAAHAADQVELRQILDSVQLKPATSPSSSAPSGG